MFYSSTKHFSTWAKPLKVLQYAQINNSLPVAAASSSSSSSSSSLALSETTRSWATCWRTWVSASASQADCCVLLTGHVLFGLQVEGYSVTELRWAARLLYTVTVSGIAYLWHGFTTATWAVSPERRNYTRRPVWPRSHLKLRWW